MAFFVSLVLCLAITVIGTTLFETSAAALPSPADGNYGLLVSVGAAVAIFLGILSSLLFDRLDKRVVKRLTFKPSDIFTASAIAPLVFLAFYPLMKETPDPVVQVLLAYQNGFVFQNVIVRVRGQA